jgi:CBS domain-containing protein
MSTRSSAFTLPFGEGAPVANREFPPVRRENFRRERSSAAQGEIVTGSIFSAPAPAVRRPCNDHQAGPPAVAIEGAGRLRPQVTARDLMRACSATLKSEDSIERAAKLMSETQSGSVPVVDDGGRLIGIISDRDITVKLIALGTSIPHAQVSDCMTAEAFACSAECSFESCVSAMSWHQVRQLPIVDDEHRVLGTISQSDLASFLCENPERAEPDAMADILMALTY